MKDKEGYPFDDFEPDFINADGVKWWKRESFTRILIEGGVKAACYNVQFPNGKKQIVLLDEKGVFFETQSLEGIGSRIDIELLIAKRRKK